MATGDGELETYGVWGGVGGAVQGSLCLVEKFMIQPSFPGSWWNHWRNHQLCFYFYFFFRFKNTEHNMMYVKIMLRPDFHLSVSVLTCGRLRP